MSPSGAHFPADQEPRGHDADSSRVDRRNLRLAVRVGASPRQEAVLHLLKLVAFRTRCLLISINLLKIIVKKVWKVFLKWLIDDCVEKNKLNLTIGSIQFPEEMLLTFALKLAILEIMKGVGI